MANAPVTVDRERFDRAMKNLIANLPQDAKAIMANEARLFLEALIAQAKPNKGKLAQTIEDTIAKRFLKAPPIIGGKRRIKYRGKVIELDRAQAAVLMKSQKEHIGWFSAGFIGSGNPLKASTPNWIRKHHGEGKTIIVSGPFGRWGVTVFNRTAFTEHYPKFKRSIISLINAMLSKRAKLMEGNLRRILKGKAEYRIKQ